MGKWWQTGREMAAKWGEIGENGGKWGQIGLALVLVLGSRPSQQIAASPLEDSGGRWGNCQERIMFKDKREWEERGANGTF